MINASATKCELTGITSMIPVIFKSIRLLSLSDLPMGLSLLKYFFASDSVITIEFLSLRAIAGFPLIKVKSKTLNNELSAKKSFSS